jgi:molybdate transport system substrate-binding protein
MFPSPARIFPLLLAFLPACGQKAQVSSALLVFAGSASRPALLKAVREFETKEGIEVDVVFGGSGQVLSQMILARKGDLYFPGSSDYMEIAKKKGVIIEASEKRLAYLVPAIAVARGNPKGVGSLTDLLRKDLSVAIANPESVCVGSYGVEVLEKNLSKEEVRAFREKLVTYTGSCAKTASAISLGAADAVMAWRIFGSWDPKRIEIVPLKKEQIPRVGYLPIALSTFNKNPKGARAFINFLASKEGRDIFRAEGYFMTAREAFDWIGSEKQVGGVYQLPEAWVSR